MARLSYIFLLGVLCLTGCQNYSGPLKPRSPARVDDPRLSIGEQQKLGRERLGVMEQSPTVLPQSGGGLPNAPGFR